MQICARHYVTGELIELSTEQGRITAIGPMSNTPLASEPGWVAPALFDLQINGCSGYGFSSESLTVETVRHIVSVCRQHGIGGFCPTLITNSAAALEHGFRTLREACETDARIAAAAPVFHLEGPYIST